MGCDPCGTCFHRWDFWNDCEKCGGKTIGDKWNDVAQWCEDAYNYVTNDDPQKTQQNLQKDNFSFYKGAMVFSTQLPFYGSAFSFGVIVMDSCYEKASNAEFEQTLNHEYGHFVHMTQIGMIAYAHTTAIPSAISAAIANSGKTEFSKWMYDNYYNLPTERIADQFGGVNRGYATGANTVGTLYWLITVAYSRIA